MLHKAAFSIAPARAFKATGFSRAMCKAGITDAELCKAIAQGRANIDAAELNGFRQLAKAYAGLTAAQVEALLADKDWMEICRETGKQETAS